MKKPFICLLLLLFFWACNNNNVANNVSDTQEIDEDFDLYTVETNNMDDLNEDFLIKFPEQLATDITLEIKKTSGSVNRYFGLIYGIEHDRDIIRTFEINCNGDYRIRWYNEETGWHNITEFNSISEINQGLGEINKLRVCEEDINDDNILDMVFYINDQQVNCVTGLWSEGGFGYYYEIGDNTTENFPEISVKIDFKILESSHVFN